jgi:hypothetical protein
LIQNSDFVINSPFGVYIPDFLSTLEHIYNKVTDSNFISAGTGKGFILNDKYNLVAPIFKVSTFSIISYILVLIYIAVIINYIKSIKIPTISILFIETLLIFSVFMLFMGWSFFALKLLFLIFIMLSIDWNIIIKKFLSVKGNL